MSLYIYLDICTYACVTVKEQKRHIIERFVLEQYTKKNLT